MTNQAFGEIFVAADALSLRFWINDPVEGSTNVKCAVLLSLWDAFKREGIAFPSHIQDMRLREPVRIATEAGS